MLDEQKLVKWLIPTIIKPKGTDLCMTIQCRHYNKEAGTYSPPIEEWAIREPGSSQLLMEVEALKDEIMTRIQEDSSTLEGHQQYVLIPYFGEGKTQQKGRLIIKVFGISDDDDVDASVNPVNTEAATTKGISQQKMRHDETMFQLNTKGIHGTMDRLQAALDKQVAKNEILEARIYRTLDIVEKLTSQAAKRALDAQESAMKMEFFKGMADKFSALLPSLVNYVAGGQLLEESNHPVVMILEDWITGFEPEEWSNMEPMLLGKLDPAKRLPVQKMIEAAFDKKRFQAAKAQGNQLSSLLPVDTKQLGQG